jgi:uncharacterized membrane protein YkoI
LEAIEKTTDARQKQINSMKSRILTQSILTLAVTLGLCLTGAIAQDKDDAKLVSQAKISKVAAQTIALGKVTDGTVKSAEIEKEGGKLIWSLDLTRSGSKDVTEVAVDALTVKIVSVDVETPKDQAKESKEDKEAAEEKVEQAKLASKAKISQAEAEKIALGKAPNGKVKKVEIEKEFLGKLTWEIKLTTPGTTDITVVEVNAMTGKVGEVETKKAKVKEEKK